MELRDLEDRELTFIEQQNNSILFSTYNGGRHDSYILITASFDVATDQIYFSVKEMKP